MGLQLPSRLALFLTLAFIVFLFWRDIRERPDVSSALWLPVLWLVICCSRGWSVWLNILGLPVPLPASAEEGGGSPVDQFFYLALATAGFCVLNKRQVQLSEIVRNNGWVIAFFLYCFISIAWADFPLVSFKQWIKIFGHPIMALIVLTEPDPIEALKRLMKRCAYVVIPVSILWIKYFPRLGRMYSPWGEGLNIGVSVGKNGLGCDCLILGFFFFWHFLQTWKTERTSRRRNELWLIAGFLLGIWWLLSKAHSATAFISLFIAILMVVFVRIRSIKNFIGTYLLAALVILAALELTLGVSGDISESLGKGSGLSGRIQLWSALLGLHTNPILGTGFESFWLGERLEKLEGIFFFIPNEAHNGYVEIYLSLGIIGLSILIGLFIATFWRIRVSIFRNFEWGRYRLGFLAVVLLYNWTEAAFRSYNPVWFVFFLIALEYPRYHLSTAEPSLGAPELEANRDLKYAEAEL